MEGAMRTKRPFIFLAMCGALLGGAAACNRDLSTGVDTSELANPIVRDTSPMAPLNPLGPGR
jgi:hypothetical protein